MASRRMQIRRHIPSGPDAAGARCFQLPPVTPKHPPSRDEATPAAGALFLCRDEAATFPSGSVRRVDRMAKAAGQFACTECGYSAGRWFGKCPGCNSFGTLVEEIVGKVVTGKAPPKPLLRLVD